MKKWDFLYRKTNIHAVKTSGEKFISSLHCVAKKEKSKRVPELGGRELTDLSPDVLTAYTKNEILITAIAIKTGFESEGFLNSVCSKRI